MSNPHKFYAELLSTYVHNLFDHKVKATILIDPNEISRELGHSNSYYIRDKGQYLVKVKCKSFELFFVIDPKNEAMLDKPFEECPILMSEFVSYYNSSSKTVRFDSIKNDLLIISNVIAPSVGFTNKKYIQYDQQKNISNLETTAKESTLRIDFKAKSITIKVSSVLEEVDLTLTDDEDGVIYFKSFDDFNKDVKASQKDLKNVITDYNKMRQYVHDTFDEKLEKIKQEYLEYQAVTFNRDYRELKEEVNEIEESDCV